MPFAGEPLHDRHDRDRFESGKPELDGWLRAHALTVEARRTGRTFVWHDNGRVVGYYTLAAHLIVREGLPRSIGRGNPTQIPAVLLARLALDKSLQGQGLGGALLADSLARVVAATRTVAARYVVVDAIDRAAQSFYAHHGFREIPSSLRLVQKITDIAAAIGD
ncbi:GNAT family N-acetyltransferase [Asanoa siamensis]|uniref:N-acetyltransferase GCN5 n=1 Tax=Asanoa siamensis TaxID=926357 RepID=A0ABQ4CW50_9ACTN|nr:GNAT family N-acetyltransferase [Asanoa siamensis]GIF75523.1 N-acetyltransferase GCN5 [Asanoa siamensis]